MKDLVLGWIRDLEVEMGKEVGENGSRLCPASFGIVQKRRHAR